jgi:hypothetical protein
MELKNVVYPLRLIAKELLAIEFNSLFVQR